MATVYSGNYSTGTYTYTRVKVDYSGTSATATLLYTRTNNYTYPTYETNGTFTFGGASTGFNVSFTGAIADAVVASVSFPISMAGGTYSGSASGQVGTFFNFSGSVNIPAQTSPPSATVIMVSNVTSTSADVTYRVTSWGYPSTGRWARKLDTVSPPTTDWVAPDPNYAARLSFTETLTGLSPDTTYYIIAHGGNGSQTGANGSISFRTNKTYNLYGSVNQKAKGIDKLYASVEGKSVEVKKLYGSIGGKSALVYP